MDTHLFPGTPDMNPGEYYSHSWDRPSLFLPVSTSDSTSIQKNLTKSNLKIPTQSNFK